jgi:hypothetical protein
MDPVNISFVPVCKLTHFIQLLLLDKGMKGIRYWHHLATLLMHKYLYTDHIYEMEIMDNHRSVLCSFEYFTPRWKTWSSVTTGYLLLDKCSMKPLSKLLTSILWAVNTRLQSYCDTSYSRGGVTCVNQMLIPKYS